MKIVTDSGADLLFSEEVLKQIEVGMLPLVVNLDGKSYREDIDITTQDFYNLLEATDSLPTTSLPPAGDFADVIQGWGKMGKKCFRSISPLASLAHSTQQ